MVSAKNNVSHHMHIILNGITLNGMDFSDMVNNINILNVKSYCENKSNHNISKIT